MSEKNKDEKQKELDCQEQENAQIRETGEAVLDQNSTGSQDRTSDSHWRSGRA